MPPRKSRGLPSLLLLFALGVSGDGCHSEKPVAPMLTNASVTPQPLESLPLRGIVIHHTQSPAIWHGVRINEARLNDIHRETHPGWRIEWRGKVYYIGYHYVILPDGTVEQGRPEPCLGAHARTYNNWLGICLVGSFATNYRQFSPGVPTVAQLTSLIGLCEDLMIRYRIPAELVKRHQDVNETDCPGNRFPYQKVENELLAFAKAHRDTVPLPPVGFKIVKPPHLHSHKKTPASQVQQSEQPKPSQQEFATNP